MNELNIFLFVTNICVIIFCGALFPIMPFLTRKSFLFGVKVPPKAQNAAESKALKRNYITITAIGGIIVLAASVWQYIAAPNHTIYAVMLFPFFLAAVQLAAFVPNHKKAQALKAEFNWHVAEISVADTKTSFTRGNLSAMPHFWYIISGALVFASFAVALARYPNLPDPIPTHWNFNMEADAWSPKTLWTVLLLPVFNIGMTAFMWLVGVLIEKTKLQIDHAEPKKSFAQHKKYRRLMGHGIGFTAFGIAVMFFLLGLQSVFIGFTVPLWLILGLGAGPCVPLCVIAVRAGQSGTLLKADTKDVAGANGDANGNNIMSDDKYWAWGLFYHNPNDPACFVGDRFGGNIGFNYSKLPVKIGVIIGVLALLAFYVWMFVLIGNLF
jgi:uncharacterized membrane protein